MGFDQRRCGGFKSFTLVNMGENSIVATLGADINEFKTECL